MWSLAPQRCPAPPNMSDTFLRLPRTQCIRGQRYCSQFFMLALALTNIL